VQLSQNLFAEITGVSLAAPCGVEAQNERRQHRRVPFDQRARIFPLMEGVGENGGAVLVRDISVAGIGFLYSEPISVGDEFVLRLPTTTDQTIDIQCAARRCELGGTCGSQFAVGATFELVLSRPLSSCIAPESEMLPEGEPIADQPAPPSIEQRYDQQLVTARLIRPIIRETRWDRWMAKPICRKISRVLSTIFWPVLMIWKGIDSIVRAGEESRIRSRLTPNKAGKKSRRRGQSAVALPPPVEVAPPAPQPVSESTQQQPMGVLHPSLFEMAETRPAVTPAPAALALSSSVQPAAGRPSLFEPVQSDPVEIVAVENNPPPPRASEPVPAQRPSEGPNATPPPASEHETVMVPVVELSPPGASSAATHSSQEPAEATPPVLVEEQSPNDAEDGEAATIELPTPSVASVPSTEALHDQPPVPKVRPPVAHPRQMRRRSRPTFHR
jgi:hypothetical protein